MSGMTQRDAFFDTLYQIAVIHKDVVIVSADMGAPSLDKFRKDLSGQYIGTGIAEQQMIALAAGLALEGKKVFAYAIIPFITMRCYEQIRLELAAMNIPVTIVGVGAGFSYDDSGPTHHAVEDISILRALPNLRINNITDALMASEFARLSCTFDYPNYVRLDRKPLSPIYEKGDDFTEGLYILAEGEIYIIATGNMVRRALEVANELRYRNRLDVGIIDLHTLPINVDRFVEAVRAARLLITLEEHSLRGGMGSAVCETLADNDLLIPVKRLGLDLTDGYCYQYGGREYLQSLYGLDKESLIKSILEYSLEERFYSRNPE